MKKLRQYQKFDTNAFLKGKTAIVGGIKQTTSEKDQKDGYTFILKLMIVGDPDNDELNQGEALNIKFKNAPTIKVGHTINFDNVRLKNPIGTVYGDYSNELSIKADGMGSVAKVSA